MRPPYPLTYHKAGDTWDRTQRYTLPAGDWTASSSLRQSDGTLVHALACTLTELADDPDGHTHALHTGASAADTAGWPLATLLADVVFEDASATPVKRSSSAYQVAVCQWLPETLDEYSTLQVVPGDLLAVLRGEQGPAWPSEGVQAASEAAQAAAELAAAESATAQAAAQSAASAASLYASAADSLAASAEASASTATTQAGLAAASASTASAQAIGAANSAGTATTQAGLAAASASASALSAASAQDAAQDATTQAASASASAATAAAEAASATASAADAAASASVAQAAELAAAESATAAAASALTSGTQAGMAAASAEAAAASAADAATSQGLAGTYATTAADAAQAAQDAAADAVAVVTGGTASLTAAAGKIPIADASGKIDPAWLDPIAGVSAAALHRSPNAITALFVYDTAKDSDGGAWTERCQHTSWYNEALSGRWLGQAVSEAAARAVTGATTGDYFQLSTDGKFYKLNAGSGTTEVFRGNKRNFPKLAAVVAEAASLTIYDLTESGRPMWMRFSATATATVTAKTLLSGANSVAAVNGKVLVGGSGTNLTGLTTVDFAADRASLRLTSGYTWAGTIATRHAAGGYGTVDSTVGAIVNATVNAIAVTVLPDAPVDPVTGLRAPTIAVATNGGISVIQHSGSVRNSSSTSAFGAIHISPAMLSATRTSDATLYTALAPGLLGSSFALSTRTSTQAPGFGVGNTSGLIRTTRSELTRRSATAGLVQRLRAWEADVSKSVAATITDSCNTGHMVGDIRRAYLADVSAGSIGPSTELVTNGDFSAGGANWIQATPTRGDYDFSAGTAKITNDYTNGSTEGYTTLLAAANIVAGKTYCFEFDVVSKSGSLLAIFVSNNTDGTAGTIVTQANFSAIVDNRVYWIATVSRAYIVFQIATSADGVFWELDNISVKEVVADRSYKAQGIPISGTLTKTAVATGAQLVAYSGFSASNYLQEPYSADLDFGTGEWTCSAWITVPTGNAAAGTIAARAHSSGASITLGIDATNKITATAYDGTTTRTVTTTGAYNTATGVKAEATYRAGRLAILVNGVERAVAHGTPLLTLNNSNAVLTIGNSYALDAPFPGSITLLKFSATVPTAEQSAWMYEQEKQMFRENAQVCLPDSGAVVDLAYDDATDKWIAASASNRSEWTGLVRTSTTAVPAGSYSRAAAGSGVLLTARSTTSPGVDVTLPELGLRRELARRAEAAARLAAQPAVLDYVGGFTATTTNGGSALTSVSGLSVPGMVNLVGCQVTGSGIPASTTITGISGTTIYLSAAATAGASGVQISLVDFPLPTGLEAKTVSVAGALKQEGASATWTRQYDGFREAVRFGTAPGYNAWVQITAIRSLT